MTVETSITPGQRKQYLRFVEDAAERALEEIGLDKNSIQKLIEHGGEFQSGIADLIAKLSASRYADEEVKPDYGYPKGFAIKPIADQIEVLRGLFPGLNTIEALVMAENLPSLPDGAEGWFAIPNPGLAGVASPYNETTKVVLEKIADSRNFLNYREGMLGPKYLRLTKRTERMLKKLSKQQKSNILIVPAQFGLLRRGRSVGRAREVFAPNEFGLGPYAVGIMLLTHPKRLGGYNDLFIDCAGAEYSSIAVGRSSYALFFSFCDGRVRFGAHWVGCAHDHCGSVSAFLPQET